MKLLNKFFKSILLFPGAAGSTASNYKQLIKSLIIILLIVGGIRGSIFEPYKIPSESMVPTLLIGDRIFVTKFDYGLRLAFITKMFWNYRTPERGDVVVFTRPDDPNSPEDDSSINLIKRVIGLPGDTVEVFNGKVFINDVPLNEPYAVWLSGGGGPSAVYKVPQDSVFLMGDNRDHSKDARFWTDPYIPISRIKGKARRILLNFSDMSRTAKSIE